MSADRPTSESQSGGMPIRPLPVLRAMIDAIDRELLQLLARRNGLVADVAEYKRENGLPVRDPSRESELIADRRERGGALGLSPELVESMFRLVLWGSRERQSALRAEVPRNIEPRTIAIIGGRGGMGRCMAKLFGDLGHAVMISDVDTPLRPEDAAAAADVVVLSVPIDATLQVIEDIGPHVKSEALLMDVTSIKAAPLEAMLKASTASVVGTHPLFGPGVHSLQGQRIVVCRGRGDAWAEWLEKMLHARGLVVQPAAADEHDRNMAVVQVLVHFATEVLGRTLVDLDASLTRTLDFTSPIYLLELLMTARHFGQSPDLYASIQMNNPETGKVTETFARAAENLRDVVARGDREAFSAMFTDVRELFGSFTDQALEQSSFLIDRLVERTDASEQDR